MTSAEPRIPRPWKHTEHRPFGLLGEDAVNVLELNLALDRLGS